MSSRSRIVRAHPRNHRLRSKRFHLALDYTTDLVDALPAKGSEVGHQPRTWR